MHPEMTNEEYMAFVLSKLSDAAKKDMELNAALGLAGEAGEICDLIKKQRFQDHHVWQGWMMDELSDVIFYVFMMLAAQGWTFQEVIANNVRKLNERYPEGFDAERSMNRK